ncbi:MAG: hypothetical protein SFX73_01065 [Kofleriaceae bacterium]|nr:hypothetical protein [Kofleriaceae bacterium]
MRNYVAFDLGISLGEVSKVTFRPVDDPPDDVYTWRVVCAHGVVTITTRESGKVVEIGRAIWSKRQLTQRTCKAEGYPNDHHWQLVRDGLDANDAAGAPNGGTGTPPAGPRRPPLAANTYLWIAVASVIAVLAVVFYFLVAATPQPSKPSTPTTAQRSTPPPAVATHASSPPPPPPPPASAPLEVRVANAASLDAALALAKPSFDTDANQGYALLQRYAVRKLSWDDVATPTTSVGLVLKDARIERGKRLCASGTIGSIERGDVAQRAVYRGELRTSEDDEIEFLAVGSTGTLVRRDQGTLCGVVIGKAGDKVHILGMFDLPENRSPAVEREVP